MSPAAAQFENMPCMVKQSVVMTLGFPVHGTLYSITWLRTGTPLFSLSQMFAKFAQIPPTAPAQVMR